MAKRKPSFLVGDYVSYHSVIGGPITSTGHTITCFGVVCGRVVAWITGKAGCVALEALTLEARDGKA